MRIILNETEAQEKCTLPNTGKWPVTYSCAQPFYSDSVLNYFSHHICTADLSSKECFCTRLNSKMRGQQSLGRPFAWGYALASVIKSAKLEDICGS